MNRNAQRTGAGPGAGRLTRRLFLNGGLKASLAAGLMSHASLSEILAGPATARHYDGRLIEESYGVAHSLRDGTLSIPELRPEGRLHDAIVLGGGISGLMAAWDLKRGGLEDVVLYDKEDYVGGNARKAHANGTDYSCATWSVARPRDPFLTGVLKDLDVIEGFAADGTPRIRSEFVGTGPDFNVLIDGRYYLQPSGPDTDLEAIGARLPLSARDRRDLVALFNDFGYWETHRGSDGRPAFAMPVEEGSRDASVLELDRITMRDYAVRKGWGPATIEVIDEWSTSTIGGTVSEVSAYAFLSFNSLGQGGEDITLPGGNAWLAGRLADRVGYDHLLTGLTAVRVTNEGNEVRVVLIDPATGRFSMRRARSAVIACPKQITGRMVPGLTGPGREALAQYTYGALLMGAASVSHTPVLKGDPLAWYNSVHGRLIQGFLVGDYNSERWRSGDVRRPNVLCLWAPLGGKVERQDLLDNPWSHWADRMADDLEYMIPGVQADLTRLDIYVWGHHMVIPRPGFLTGDGRARLTRPLGNITFAHSDRHGMPSFELAARAGHDAALEAIAAVRRRGGKVRTATG